MVECLLVASCYSLPQFLAQEPFAAAHDYRIGKYGYVYSEHGRFEQAAGLLGSVTDRLIR